MTVTVYGRAPTQATKTSRGPQPKPKALRPVTVVGGGSRASRHERGSDEEEKDGDASRDGHGDGYCPVAKTYFEAGATAKPRTKAQAKAQAGEVLAVETQVDLASDARAKKRSAPKDSPHRDVARRKSQISVPSSTALPTPRSNGSGHFLSFKSLTKENSAGEKQDLAASATPGFAFTSQRTRFRPQGLKDVFGSLMASEGAKVDAPRLEKEMGTQLAMQLASSPGALEQSEEGDLLAIEELTDSQLDLIPELSSPVAAKKSKIGHSETVDDQTQGDAQEPAFASPVSYGSDYYDNDFDLSTGFDAEPAAPRIVGTITTKPAEPLTTGVTTPSPVRMPPPPKAMLVPEVSRAADVILIASNGPDAYLINEDIAHVPIGGSGKIESGAPAKATATATATVAQPLALYPVARDDKTGEATRVWHEHARASLEPYDYFLASRVVNAASRRVGPAGNPGPGLMGEDVYRVIKAGSAPGGVQSASVMADDEAQCDRLVRQFSEICRRVERHFNAKIAFYDEQVRLLDHFSAPLAQTLGQPSLQALTRWADSL